MAEEIEVHEGGCLCGRVRFRALGRPRWQAVCHCRYCQRVTGSACNAEVVFLKEDVVFSAAPAVYEHKSPDHGRKMLSHFCAHCGVTVGLGFERFPAVQAILAGAFDEPAWVAFDKHIFTATALPWMAYTEEMDLFTGHSILADGTAATPDRHAVRT